LSIALGKTGSAWGKLLRIPNLFTVPGDVIAGALWAGTALSFSLTTVWTCIGILFVYAAGLLFNDYFDRHTDSIERPARPLPAGEISAQTVYAAAWAAICLGNLIVFAGAGLGAGTACIFISACVLLYDAGFKKNRTAGPLLMGMCRGGSVITGALAAGASFVSFPAAAGIIGLYIGYVTFLAADEAENREPGPEVFIPGMVVFAGVLFVLIRVPLLPAAVFGLILLAAAGIEATRAAYKTETGSVPVPGFISRMLRILIVIQAAWAAIALHHGSLSAVLGVTVCFALLRAGAELSSLKFSGS